MGKVKLDGFVCERCKHKWLARRESLPVVCPRCKSGYWNIPRKRKKKYNRKRGKND